MFMCNWVVAWMVCLFFLINCRAADRKARSVEKSIYLYYSSMKKSIITITQMLASMKINRKDDI